MYGLLDVAKRLATFCTLSLPSFIYLFIIIIIIIIVNWKMVSACKPKNYFAKDFLCAYYQNDESIAKRDTTLNNVKAMYNRFVSTSIGKVSAALLSSLDIYKF